MENKCLINSIDNALIAEIKLLSSSDFTTKEQSTRIISALSTAREKITTSKLHELALNK